MKERKEYTGGLSVRQMLCMVVCVILAGLVLVFGEHERTPEPEYTVESEYEAVDGDLDFGHLMGEGTNEADVLAGVPTPTAVPTATPAADGTESVAEYEDEQFCYVIEEGVAVLTVCKDAALKYAVIPADVKGVPVEIIGAYAFQNCSALEQVVFPEGLKTIQWNAFENCISLTTIEFPASLVTICECAFWNTGLTQVTVPKTVRVLEDYAFAACEQLTELTLGTTENLDSVFDMSIVTLVTVMDGVVSLDEDAFAYAQELREVRLPSSLTLIKPYAFWECTSLEKLELPEGLVSIGENAFESCSSLREMKLPESLLLLSEYAFCNCEALERVTIPDGITAIQESVFQGCDKLVLTVGSGSLGEEYAITNELLYENR